MLLIEAPLQQVHFPGGPFPRLSAGLDKQTAPGAELFKQMWDAEKEKSPSGFPDGPSY
jgi:hypothetical protein